MLTRESYCFWDNDPSVSLEAYVPTEGENRAAFIVLPGGAYFALSDREGAEVAEYFAYKGFAAFVLRYSTMHPAFDKPHTPINPHTVFPEPMLELASAIKLIRENSVNFGVDANKICIMGFSAGGHLAANYANEWTCEYISSALGCEKDDIKPNCSILCYGATKLHRASKTMNLAVFGSCDGLSDDMLSRYSAAGNVNRDTPPTFIWHTATDNMVNVSQSVEMATALAEEGISYELHIFSEGNHAMGLSENLPAEPWKELAISFIERYT